VLGDEFGVTPDHGANAKRVLAEGPGMTPRFISIPDFCARYSVNRQKAYDLINAGAIVAVKNVGKTRFRPRRSR
jgi:hypothetical protein